MRTGFRLAALGVLTVTLALWFFGGPNLGWTKTSVAVPFKDDITGIDAVRWEQRFLPGLDFLAGGLVTSAVLLAISFAGRKPSLPKNGIGAS